MDSPEKTSTTAEIPRKTGSSDKSTLGVVGLVMVLLAAFAILPRVFAAKDPLSGKDAPEFSGNVVFNEASLAPARSTLKLSELRGKAVLIDFWASWCGPCQAEAPIVNTFAQRWRDRDVVVIGVNTSDVATNARAWSRSMGLSFPIVHDDDDKIAGAFNVHNLPTLVVISRTGKIVAVRQGMTDASELEELVKKALL